MKKLFSTGLIVAALAAPSMVNAEQLKGLNVLITSGDAQTQMMAMVLSTMTVNKHKKMVNITLCGPAGSLAIKDEQSTPVKKPDGTEATPKMAMMGLIKAGAKVEVCPLYLPNIGKDKSALIEGVGIAQPPMVAGNLLNSEFNNISF
jgi:predicted peroxiredoxin